MKKLIAILAFMLSSAWVQAQTGNTVLIRFPGVPTGDCSSIMVAVDDATGDYYDCDAAGNWFKVGPGGGGGVNSVTGTLPISSSGGVNPDISISQSGALTNGYLSFVDWNFFNNKQPTLSTHAAVANNFLTGFTAPNTFTAAQPSCGNLSDSGTGCSGVAYPGLPRLDQVLDPTADKTFDMGAHPLTFNWTPTTWLIFDGSLGFNPLITGNAIVTSTSAQQGYYFGTYADSSAGSIPVFESIRADVFPTGNNSIPITVFDADVVGSLGDSGTWVYVRNYFSEAPAPLGNTLVDFYGFYQANESEATGNSYSYYTEQNAANNKWSFYGAGTAASHFGGTTDAPVFNATTGFQVGGAATLANVLRGDGTNFVDAQLSCADLSDEGTGCAGAAYPGLVAHKLLSITHTGTTAADPVRGDIIYADSTPSWTKLALGAATAGKYAKSDGTDVVISTGSASGTGACGGGDFVTALNADAAPTCATPPGGSGTTVTVNGVALAATTGDLDDATPAAPASGFNVHWQKDALTPTNISAHLLTTDIGTTTFGSGAGITWTFNAGATDPVIAFTSGNIKYSGATTYTYEGGASDPIWTPGNGTMDLSAGALLEAGNAVPNATDKLSFFAATTSAELAGVLSDETGGAGVAVFASTPTIATPSFTTGFTIGGAAAAGAKIIGNGTNFVSGTPNGAQVGSVFVSKSFTNIGASYVDVYVTAFDAENMMIVDFTGVTSVRAVWMWDYVGAGTQNVRWVDAADNANVLITSANMAADCDACDTGWVALPAAFVGATKTIEWQAKSTTAGDDPIAKGYVLFVR